MEKKVQEHLKLLGCTSSTQMALAYQVFVQLFDVKLMHDVELFYNETLHIPYLTAKSSKTGAPHIFVPHSTSDSVNMKEIEELQNNLCGDNAEKSITLACVAGDSTMVFYTYSKNLLNPQNPEYFLRQKTREERKDFLEKEIRKDRNSLLVDAYKQSIIDT